MFHKIHITENTMGVPNNLLYLQSVIESRDLVSFSRPVFWSLGLCLEGLRSRLVLEGYRSRALCLETLHRLFFMKFCKEFLEKTVLI